MIKTGMIGFQPIPRAEISAVVTWVEAEYFSLKVPKESHAVLCLVLSLTLIPQILIYRMKFSRCLLTSIKGQRYSLHVNSMKMIYDNQEVF